MKFIKQISSQVFDEISVVDGAHGNASDHNIVTLAAFVTLFITVVVGLALLTIKVAFHS